MSKFTCPRRVEDGTDREDSPFTFGGSNKDTWDVREHDGLLHCAYCGSVDPTQFIDYLRNGGQLGVTDKNYKAYLGDAGRGKFYYQHLSLEQRAEFIRMLNAKEVNFGWPGHFTVLPFFIGRAS